MVAGGATVPFTIDILDDSVAEPSETFTLTITTGAGSGTTTVTTITITDDDGEFLFCRYDADEDILFQLFE